MVKYDNILADLTNSSEQQQKLPDRVTRQPEDLQPLPSTLV